MKKKEDSAVPENKMDTKIFIELFLQIGPTVLNLSMNPQISKGTAKLIKYRKDPKVFGQVGLGKQCRPRSDCS